VIVADTGALVALIDGNDRHHVVVRDLFEEGGDDWVLPWAILPEVDYLVGRFLGPRARAIWMSDLAQGLFTVEWGTAEDLRRAQQLCVRYADLDIGLVDGVVAAVAERLGAHALVTLDERDFGAMELSGNPILLPRGA
jgi:hypothetical protein